MVYNYYSIKWFSFINGLIEENIPKREKKEHTVDLLYNKPKTSSQDVKASFKFRL